MRYLAFSPKFLKTNLTLQVVLYEDELDDNGCAKLSVKMRAMPSGISLMSQIAREKKERTGRRFLSKTFFRVLHSLEVLPQGGQDPDKGP